MFKASTLLVQICCLDGNLSTSTNQLPRFHYIIHFKSILSIFILMDNELFIMVHDIKIRFDCIIIIHPKKIAINLIFLNHTSLETQEFFKIYSLVLRSSLRSRKNGYFLLKWQVIISTKNCKTKIYIAI